MHFSLRVEQSYVVLALVAKVHKIRRRGMVKLNLAWLPARYMLL